MTTVLDAPAATSDIQAAPQPPASEPRREPPRAKDAVARPPASPALIALATSISAAAAAWMIGGLFREFAAHIVGLVGVVIGGATVILAHRVPRARWVQWLTVPIAVVVGVIITAPDLNGGATIGRLVSDAVRNGGLLQPPVAFDPGWKIVLVALLAIVTTGAASLAVALQRPRLGVALSLPLTAGAAIIQPNATQLVSTGVAIALIVVAMSIAQGAELGRTGQVAAGFEARRIGRTTALAVALFAVIAILNNAGFLFPQPDRSRVVPPQPPPVSPPLSDRVLLSYRAATALPLRMGVIDVYDDAQHQWLLPEYDAHRLQLLQPPVTIPDAPPPRGTLQTITLTMGDWDGHALPSVAELAKVKGIDGAISYDPRTQALSLADRPVTPGLQYTLEASPLPSGKQLAGAGTPPTSLHQFMSAPAPPNQAVVVIQNCRQAAARAGAGSDLFDMLQCARQQLYAHVIAAGPGTPVAVSPAQVGQMLDGAQATPYEITAGETLLARWVGVPARLGYGYYGGIKQADGTYQVHPTHGATWLEAYFNGAGWIPLVGQPAHATPSTNPNQKNNVPSIATNHLQLVLYIPFQRPTLLLLYEYVQYFAIRTIPVLLLIAACITAYPWFVKRLRSRRRRRWARATGLPQQIAVAYCELRDRARDLGAGDPSATPLAFLRSIAPDSEHEELAWLVSRALYGDLRRDLRAHDALAAETLSRSVASRLDRAQPMVNRVLGRISRASLRRPYSTEVPNLWWELRPLGWLRQSVHVPWRRRARRRPAWAVATSLLALVIVGCGTGSAGTVPTRTLAGPLVPAKIGDISLVAQTALTARFRSADSDALVSDGRVYTVDAGGITDGDVQVELFKPSVSIDDINDETMSSACADDPQSCQGHEVFKGIQADFGSDFHRLYYDGERIYKLALSDQTVYVWFPPNTETMVILVLVSRFGPATDGFMHAILDSEHHRPVHPVTVPTLNSGGSA